MIGREIRYAYPAFGGTRDYRSPNNGRCVQRGAAGKKRFAAVSPQPACHASLLH